MTEETNLFDKKSIRNGHKKPKKNIKTFKKNHLKKNLKKQKSRQQKNYKKNIPTELQQWKWHGKKILQKKYKTTQRKKSTKKLNFKFILLEIE